MIVGNTLNTTQNFEDILNRTKDISISPRRVIVSYIRSWERPGDLPRVIEILCLFGVERSETSEKK